MLDRELVIREAELFIRDHGDSAYFQVVKTAVYAVSVVGTKWVELLGGVGIELMQRGYHKKGEAKTVAAQTHPLKVE